MVTCRTCVITLYSHIPGFLDYARWGTTHQYTLCPCCARGPAWSNGSASVPSVYWHFKGLFNTHILIHWWHRLRCKVLTWPMIFLYFYIPPFTHWWNGHWEQTGVHCLVWGPPLTFWLVDDPLYLRSRAHSTGQTLQWNVTVVGWYAAGKKGSQRLWITALRLLN